MFYSLSRQFLRTKIFEVGENVRPHEKVRKKRETHRKIDGLLEIVDLFRLSILFNFDI